MHKRNPPSSASASALCSSAPLTPPPSAAQQAAAGSTSPKMPTCVSHFPATLVPLPQMSKPSQRTSDCRPVGRSGNREKRPRATHLGRAARNVKALARSTLAFPASPSGFCFAFVAVLFLCFVPVFLAVLCGLALTQLAVHVAAGQLALGATRIVPDTASNRPQHGTARRGETGQGKAAKGKAALRKDAAILLLVPPQSTNMDVPVCYFQQRLFLTFYQLPGAAWQGEHDPCSFLLQQGFASRQPPMSSKHPLHRHINHTLCWIPSVEALFSSSRHVQAAC